MKIPKHELYYPETSEPRSKDSVQKCFSKLLLHIAIPIFDFSQAHIQGSIYEKCLVRDVSLQQSLPLLDHFFSNRHLM